MTINSLLRSVGSKVQNNLSSLFNEFDQSVSVSFDVAFSSLGDFISLLLKLGLSVGSGLDSFFLKSLISFLSFLDVLWNHSLSLGALSIMGGISNQNIPAAGLLNVHFGF